MNKKKIRTVTVNERGQMVIPEDVRKDLDIGRDTTLVLIERGEEIVLKKESAFLEAVEGDDAFWRGVAAESMRRAWGPEDAVWDKIYKEEGK